MCVGGGGLYVPEGEGERGREVGRVRGRGKVRESEKIRMCTSNTAGGGLNSY